MSKYDSKKLSYAVLHGPIHHPSIGQIGPVLQSVSDSQRSAVTMTVCEPWVLLEVPSKKDKKKTVELLIPTSGFTHTVLE